MFEQQDSAFGTCRIALLSDGAIARIDSSLISYADERWRMVAVIVSSAINDCGGEITGIAHYARRVVHLISTGKLHVIGNLRRLEFCEVRLPHSGQLRLAGMGQFGTFEGTDYLQAK